VFFFCAFVCRFISKERVQTMRRMILIFAVLAALLGGSAHAHADTIAVSFTYGTAGPSTLTTTSTIGYEFSVAAGQSITVTKLGVFDANTSYYNNGAALSVSHMVGIWSSSGTLLTSATVAAGATDPISGAFRYVVPTTQVTLSGGLTGADFYIGAAWTSFTDNIIQFGNASGGSETAASPITILGATYNNGSGLNDPTTSAAPPGGSIVVGFFGPNFEFTPASATPEPATLTLLSISALGLLVYRLRRRKLAAP
jgi:hypothetical protein